MQTWQLLDFFYQSQICAKRQCCLCKSKDSFFCFFAKFPRSQPQFEKQNQQIHNWVTFFFWKPHFVLQFMKLRRLLYIELRFEKLLGKYESFVCLFQVGFLYSDVHIIWQKHNL